MPSFCHKDMVDSKVLLYCQIDAVVQEPIVPS